MIWAASVGLLLLCVGAWSVRRILKHFNDRIGTLERQMNVILPPIR